MSKYKQVGVVYWGAGDKKLEDFKKMFKKVIPPKEMKQAFDDAKKEYKELFPTKVKASKD